MPRSVQELLHIIRLVDLFFNVKSFINFVNISMNKFSDVCNKVKIIIILCGNVFFSLGAGGPDLTHIPHSVHREIPRLQICLCSQRSLYLNSLISHTTHFTVCLHHDSLKLSNEFISKMIFDFTNINYRV